ncbi:IucA/IucC family protein [Gottfriedia solisilvae]|uniref:IucA/IucC family protein n=1 Tax=Gottfriedia solisilvae TaxID=1516104 RepID=UPI003D2EA169
MNTSSTQVLDFDDLEVAFKTIQDGRLLNDEMEIKTFLEKNSPHLVSLFMNSLEKGRKGILKRLVGSMLRENILELTSGSHDLYVIDTIYALNVSAIDEFWQTVLQKLQSFGLDKGRTYKIYPLHQNECIVIPISKTYAFNRIDVDGDILHVSENNVNVITHSVEFLALIRRYKVAHQEGTKMAWEQLANELVNGSANLALSYAYWERKKKELQSDANQLGVSNSIDWVLIQKKQMSQFDTSLFFEQLTIEGHNLHPGTKTKVGMKPDDVFQFAPEFDGVAQIHFVAINKAYAEWCVVNEHEEDANALLFQSYPELVRAVKKQFRDINLLIEDYVIVPVHQWQLENAIPSIYEEELVNKVIVPIDDFTVSSGSTSSFRTVVPLENRNVDSFAIKVAVNSQMTSTVRTISANTTNNSTVFTRLIQSVMNMEKGLSKTFVPVCEVAGYNFKINEDHQHKNRNLSAVLRENIESFIEENEVAIVGSSLFSESPISEKIIFAELIEKFAKETKETSIRHAVTQFIKEYASLIIPGALTLLVKYGIGLEGHLQNSVMVFKDGRPVRLLFRDWGGVRIHKERLEKHQFQAEFYPGSITVTSHLNEVHNKVFYTVFQNHFGELILQACKTYGLSERALWNEIHLLCRSVFEELEADAKYAENVISDRDALYKAKVEHKALAKMRLDPKMKGYSYAIVPNPLHEFK